MIFKLNSKKELMYPSPIKNNVPITLRSSSSLFKSWWEDQIALAIGQKLVWNSHAFLNTPILKASLMNKPIENRILVSRQKMIGKQIGNLFTLCLEG